MIYEINNKYYVKVGKDFVEVEVIVKGNNINLKPTSHKLENSNKLKYKQIDILNNKEEFLKKFNNSFSEKPNNKEIEELDEESPVVNTRRRYER